MKTLIRGAFAITMDDQIGDVADSDVLIDNDAIEYVGPRLETLPSAEIMEADGMIMIPGLIDGHRHTWEALLRGISVDWTLAHYYQGLRVVTARHYRPEDLYAANLIGILDGLDAGVTTILDWSHNINSPDHADAAIGANFDSGARVVFAYGNANDEWLPVSDVPHSRDAVRIRQQYFSSEDQLVTMQLGPRGPQYATDQVNRGDIELARELGLRMSMSVGDGEWGKTGPLFKMQDQGLLGPDIGYVHCTSLTDEELEIIAESGGLTVISPDLEAQMWGHPATLRLMEVGLKPSLSVDCVTSISGDMFGVMRTTLSVQRAWDHHVAEQGEHTLEVLKLSARDVLKLATTAGAAFCGLEDKVGSLTPGKQADLVLIDTKGINLSPLNNAIGAVVLGSQRGDVDTVLVAGNIVKRDGELTDVDVPRVIELAETGRDHVLAESGYPLHENWIPPSYEPR